MNKKKRAEELYINLKHLLREFSELHGIRYNTLFSAVQETIEKFINET